MRLDVPYTQAEQRVLDVITYLQQAQIDLIGPVKVSPKPDIPQTTMEDYKGLFDSALKNLPPVEANKYERLMASAQDPTSDFLGTYQTIFGGDLDRKVPDEIMTPLRQSMKESAEMNRALQSRARDVIMGIPHGFGKRLLSDPRLQNEILELVRDDDYTAVSITGVARTRDVPNRVLDVIGLWLRPGGSLIRNILFIYVFMNLIPVLHIMRNAAPDPSVTFDERSPDPITYNLRELGVATRDLEEAYMADIQVLNFDGTYTRIASDLGLENMTFQIESEFGRGVLPQTILEYVDRRFTQPRRVALNSFPTRLLLQTQATAFLTLGAAVAFQAYQNRAIRRDPERLIYAVARIVNSSVGTISQNPVVTLMLGGISGAALVTALKETGLVAAALTFAGFNINAPDYLWQQWDNFTWMLYVFGQAFALDFMIEPFFRDPEYMIMWTLSSAATAAAWRSSESRLIAGGVHVIAMGATVLVATSRSDRWDGIWTPLGSIITRRVPYRTVNPDQSRRLPDWRQAALQRRRQ